MVRLGFVNDSRHGRSTQTDSSGIQYKHTGGGGDEDPVEEDYHREEHREQRGMDYKQTDPKFSSNILSRVFHDNHSVGSGKSGKSTRSTLLRE